MAIDPKVKKTAMKMLYFDKEGRLTAVNKDNYYTMYEVFQMLDEINADNIKKLYKKMGG